ncbi:hypothetical protein MUU53_07700 [Rhizobium lemnae]|uniref:DUF4760 domain-containing protein n=1 Tax=Rhizobium lemnae TaxID=1214924 RepID=A0ABV8E5X0_9HYPH|nr:hypothetical protein [Rhizobium lemnae]MCJ8507796.1 hypothetical protein [Rhizobium lemnae]
MEIAAWIPLLVALLTALAGVFAYSWNKRVDRKHALLELRRVAYRNYLNSFMAMSDSPQGVDEIRRRLYQSEVELLVVGSDTVVQAVGKLSNFYAITNNDRFNRDAAEVRRLVANVCMSMRADCFEKTDLSIEEIRALVPIV